MKAPITLAIDKFIAEHLTPLLKSRGFRKKGQRFARDSGDCVQLIELDRWKYNEGTSGKFGLTAGVFYPAVCRMVDEARPLAVGFPFDPRFPPVQNCLLYLCVLPPQADQAIENLWPIDADRPLDELAVQVLRALNEQALPWLAQKARLEETLPDLTKLSRGGVWLSSVYLLCAAVLRSERTIAQEALAAVLSAELSTFFPESEREAFKVLAASIGATP